MTSICRVLYALSAYDRKLALSRHAPLLRNHGPARLERGVAVAGRGQHPGAAVMVATAAWGMDNTLSRALAERDPGQVVLAKAVLGVMATACLAQLTGEPLPGVALAIGLMLVGATGYGLSLRFYLLAQRAFGAARTGSVFAFAPIIGAAVAFALGDRSGGCTAARPERHRKPEISVGQCLQASRSPIERGPGATGPITSKCRRTGDRSGRHQGGAGPVANPLATGGSFPS